MQVKKIIVCIYFILAVILAVLELQVVFGAPTMEKEHDAEWKAAEAEDENPESTSFKKMAAPTVDPKEFIEFLKKNPIDDDFSDLCETLHAKRAMLNVKPGTGGSPSGSSSTAPSGRSAIGVSISAPSDLGSRLHRRRRRRSTADQRLAHYLHRLRELRLIQEQGQQDWPEDWLCENDML